MQSVTIITKVVSSNQAHCEVYSIKLYVIMFVSELRQIGGFLRVHRFPAPIKLTTHHDIVPLIILICYSDHHKHIFKQVYNTRIFTTTSFCIQYIIIIRQVKNLIITVCDGPVKSTSQHRIGISCHKGRQSSSWLQNKKNVDKMLSILTTLM